MIGRMVGGGRVSCGPLRKKINECKPKKMTNETSNSKCTTDSVGTAPDPILEINNLQEKFQACEAKKKMTRMRLNKRSVCVCVCVDGWDLERSSAHEFHLPRTMLVGRCQL